MRTTLPLRRLLAAACAVLGAVLVIVAIQSAGAVPERAHADFGRLIISQGGSMSHGATYAEVYRQFAAHAFLEQSLLVGVSGIVLLGVGAAAELRGEGG